MTKEPAAHYPNRVQNIAGEPSQPAERFCSRQTHPARSESEILVATFPSRVTIQPEVVQSQVPCP